MQQPEVSTRSECTTSTGCSKSSICKSPVATMARPIFSFRNEVRQASIMQWNAGGLRSRISLFRQYIFMNRIPIIVICEPNVQQPPKLSGHEFFVSSTCEERSKVVVFLFAQISHTCIMQFNCMMTINMSAYVLKRKKCHSHSLVSTYHHPDDLNKTDYKHTDNNYGPVGYNWRLQRTSLNLG